VARRVRDPYVICVASIAVVPVLQLAVSWARTPVLDVRQASPFISGVVFIMALGLVELGHVVADAFSTDRASRPVTLAAAVLVSGLMFAACMQWFDRGPREDWRQVARDSQSADVVYVWRGYIDQPLRYYSDRLFTPVAPNTVIPADPGTTRGELILSHHSAEEEASILRALSRTWIVGEPVGYAGIVRYPLIARSANSSGN
jgi:hypothetical protein